MVASWNGLAISALAECGLLFGRPDFTEAALDAAALLATVHLAGGRLVRTSRDGTAGSTAGALEDYACVAEGLLTLSGVTGEARWVELAGQLLEVALGFFGDGHGGFYDTAADDEPLIFRPADPADNATPSGTFAVAGALLRYSALAGSARHREAAGAALGVLPGIAARYPRAAGAGLAVAEAWLAGRPRSRWWAAPRISEPARCTRRRCTRPRPVRSSPSVTAPCQLVPGQLVPAPPAPKPACRCWPGASWSTERPPRTSAASSPAWPR